MDGEQCSPRVRHRLLRHSAAEGRAQNAGGALQREPGEEPLGTSTQQLTRPAHLAAAQHGPGSWATVLGPCRWTAAAGEVPETFSAVQLTPAFWIPLPVAEQ